MTSDAANKQSVLDGIEWPQHTERLTIRRARPDDADAIWAYRQRPDVSRWLSSWPREYPTFAEDHQRPQHLATSLVVEHGGELVGDLMLRIEDAWAQTDVASQGRGAQAELGWVFHPDHAGKGYATEAVQGLLRMCFDDLGLRRVTAECFAANEASWRLMERIGMRREIHRVRESLHRELGWLDGFGYAMLADEWLTSSRGWSHASGNDAAT